MDTSTALAVVEPKPSPATSPVLKHQPKRVRAKVVQVKGSVHRTYVPIDAPKDFAAGLRIALGSCSGHFDSGASRAEAERSPDNVVPLRGGTRSG